MDHVVIPLDRDHLGARETLVRGAGAAAGVDPAGPERSHVTLVAYIGPDREAAVDAVGAAIQRLTPFALHAHGYGWFGGEGSSEVTLHVPVVRGPALACLHAVVAAALVRTGATVAGWSRADRWSPHITLLDRGLDAERLGAAAAWLAARHHPTWEVPVERLLVTGGRGERDQAGTEVLIGRRGSEPFTADS